MTAFDWMEQALCSQTDPELFFPEGPASAVRSKKAKARAICSWCQVQDKCLEFALAQPWLSDGVWAGFDATELRKMRRARERAA